MYGIVIDNSTPVATYTLDGDASNVVHVLAYPGATYNFAFISEIFPLNGDEQEHTLEITINSSNRFYFDYATVQASTAYIPAFGVATQSNAPASPTSTGTSTGTSSHAAVIAGSVVPVTLCIIDLTALFIHTWRKRAAVRRQAALRDMDPMSLVTGSREHNLDEGKSRSLDTLLPKPNKILCVAVYLHNSPHRNSHTIHLAPNVCYVLHSETDHNGSSSANRDIAAYFNATSIPTN